MCRIKKRNQNGFSLVEVTVASSIMAVVLLMAVSFVTSARTKSKASYDRSFAVQKSISLLEEVRNYTQQVGDFAELDALDDGVVHNPILTIQEGVGPGHIASGNLSSSLTPSGWDFSRRLVVRPFVRDGWNVPLNIRDLRIVSALVYKDHPDNRFSLQADVGTILRSPGDQVFPTTQTYDVYFLAIENIPGWWVYMSYIKPLMEVTCEDLQARNPGLNFRAHWITASSYGRNPNYMPYINDAVDSEQDIDLVYFYPGHMPDGSAAEEYYVPSQMRARMNIDGTESNGYDALNNPFPYTLADEYNHGMRYIDELALFKNRCSVVKEDGFPLEIPSTPTWRILLEKMNSTPESFENAILINLHGELLPMPAMRNYSDAARDSEFQPGIRAVTHPEYLCTPTGNNLRLRVYAYKDLCDDTLVALGVMPNRVDEISVLIKNVNLADPANSLNITRITGGVGGVAYGKDVAVPLVNDPDVVAPPANEMCYYAEYIDNDPNDGIPGDTRIRLFNTPTICPLVSSGGFDRGLPTNWQFYGLEYIPSSTETACNFFRDLMFDDSNNPKNTARWIIEIPKEVLLNAPTQVAQELANPADGIDEVVNRLTICTRLGSDITTGILYPPADENMPENLSRTYAWWSDDRDDVPFTERSQYIGDPRHSPYADLKDFADVGFTGLFADAYGTDNPFQNHYNWWFDNFRGGGANVFANWQGYNQARIENDEGDSNDGWSDYQWRIDVPRYMQTLRTALITTDSVYTTLTGYSYYYMGIGNEIGYDSANGFSKGIPVSSKPFYGTSGTRTEQVMVPWAKPDDYAAIGYGIKLIKKSPALGANYWWGKHWIGDLYPDSSWGQWKNNNNLITGTSNNNFVRYARENITEDLPRGTAMTYARRCLQQEGCNSFFLVGDRNSTFFHAFNGANGTLAAAGDEIAEDYAFPLPTSAYINRPFRVDWAGSSSWKNNPDFDFPADYPHNSAEVIRTYYDHPWDSPNGKGSALVALTDPAYEHTSFQVMNGLSQTIESGSAFIARWSILSLVHSFLTAGEADTLNKAAVRIEQLPRVEIKQPTIITSLDDPSTVLVQWSSDFLRWDGEKYTQYYPDGFGEAAWVNNLRYVLLYSDDNGTTWYYMEDDSGAMRTEAEIAIFPEGSLAAYLRNDLDPNGDEFFSWAVPGVKFPEGSYLIRVEAYRQNKALHFAQHMEKIFIDR